MKELRTMAPKPFEIQVFRSQRWKSIMSNDLLPGDICSIVRSKEESPVPCDIIIFSGTCIVNEAMLTGESTPQLKVSFILNPFFFLSETKK